MTSKKPPAGRGMVDLILAAGIRCIGGDHHDHDPVSFKDSPGFWDMAMENQKQR